MFIFFLELEEKVGLVLEKHGLRIIGLLRYSEVKLLNASANLVIWHP